jgi:serine/threonine-protein kinase
VGLPVADAEATLADLGMQLDVASSQYSETAPKDTVISQDPAADSGAFIRFPVSVVSSLGPERYAVPDVRGATVEDATETLTDTKLAVAGQTQAFDEEVANGLVVGTDPPAGTILKPQDAVQLLVSQGPAPRPVPDVGGKSAADAQAALEAAGLVVQSTQEFSEQVPNGAVAGTNPPAGTEVAKGSTVTMVVSKGPPPVEVPRVVDMKRTDAIAKLQAAGFQVNVQQGVVTPLDRVYSQDPPPGEQRPKGSTVTISIF